MRVVAPLLLLVGCADLFNLEHIELVDAGPPEAIFDPARDCPSDYQLRLFPGSYYRFTPNSLAMYDDSDDCNDDKVGFTHLAVAQTRDELDRLIDALVQSGIGDVWIGLVQAPGARTPDEGWIWVTGEAVDPSLWAATEPNDVDDAEDAQEQTGNISSSQVGLVDYMHGFGKRGLCECDGHGMSSEADTAVDLLRP